MSPGPRVLKCYFAPSAVCETCVFVHLEARSQWPLTAVFPDGFPPYFLRQSLSSLTGGFWLDWMAHEASFFIDPPHTHTPGWTVTHNVFPRAEDRTPCSMIFPTEPSFLPHLLQNNFSECQATPMPAFDSRVSSLIIPINID